MTRLSSIELLESDQQVAGETSDFLINGTAAGEESKDGKETGFRRFKVVRSLLSL